MSPPRNTAEKFWRLVDSASGDASCWPWSGALRRRDGYAQFRYEGRSWRAHRLAWTLARGPIPEGLVIDHLCRNRACCNPSHLEPVAPAENTRRGESPAAVKGRAEKCPAGHEYVERPGGDRECLPCRRVREAELRNSRRMAIIADPSLAPHGVLSTYTAWCCRCDECTATATSYARQRRARYVVA